MPTKFNMTRDINGYNGFGLVESDTVYGVLLASAIEQNFTAPSGEYNNYLAIFSYTPGTNVFVDLTGNTAADYSGTIGAVTSELNPSARQVKAGTQISLICPDTNGSYVQVAFYVCESYGN